MTRKDFVLIAEAMKEARMHVLRLDGETTPNEAFRIALDGASQELALNLTRTNPNFDRGRFLRACGVEG